MKMRMRMEKNGICKQWLAYVRSLPLVGRFALWLVKFVLFWCTNCFLKVFLQKDSTDCYEVAVAREFACGENQSINK